MRVNEIATEGATADEIISMLTQKTIKLPSWAELEKEYDPKMHPVADTAKYPDIVTDGGIQEVTRITLNFQQLAVRRMTELISGIPIKRVYNATNEQQQEVATLMERIFKSVRIDSVNVERLSMLFSGCEVLTLWYAIEKEHGGYGVESSIKLRCRNFSPMMGDKLYPLFDSYGDLIAISVEYQRKVGGDYVSYIDTYTDEEHIQWSEQDGEWVETEHEELTLGKIPAVYVSRPTPIWEDTSKTVYEMEWVLSRNGNYLRENSKPLFCVFADEQIRYGDEGSPNDARAVIQYPKGSTANYITWSQAVDNLKFFIEQLRSLFFTQLQLPDWSYEKMSQQALSGESRKQMFIDAQLKVKDESGRLIELFDREVNVVRCFIKKILPDGYAADVDALSVENEITPFSITDDKDVITNLMTANGGAPLMSQRESIAALGWSENVDETLRAITEQETSEQTEPSI